jgi:large subunit ribosomal protein L13
MIIDGDGLILGRLASETAEMLLKGEKIDIVNAEKVVISGSQANTLFRYKVKVDRKNFANPYDLGPHYPKTPDGIVLRTIRDMANYTTARGRHAMKNLRVYIGVPEQYSKSKLVKLEYADSKKLHGRVTTVGEVSKHLGYKW